MTQASWGEADGQATSLATDALETTRAPCPSCGADAPEALERLPGQLLATPQTFRAGRCGRCGLAYLVDRVVDADQARLYDLDYPLHRGPALWGPVFAPLVRGSLAATDRRRVRVVRAHRELSEDDAVLDVGCGRPTFLARLREVTGADVHGLDALEDPAAHADAAAQGVALHRGLPPELPASLRAAAPFAAITLWHALEHDPRPAETLAVLGEQLAPDGVLVVEVPDGSGAAARRLGARWGGLHTPRHASFYEPETLRDVVQAAGLEVVAHARSGTLTPFVPVALGVADALGFRFGRHPAWLLFPAWVLGMALTWPWLGRAGREGQGIQLVVARRRRDGLR